jgi:CRP-like cAMP-binding protein
MSQLSNYPQFRNQLLAKLSLEELDLLGPHLKPVQLDIRHVLETANEPIQQVYFADSGFASIVAKDADRETEVGIIGREGVTGLPVLLGDEQSPNDTFIQLAGSGHLLPVDALRSGIEKSRTLRATLLRFVHAMAIQMANTALANSKVKVDARLARWLLMAHDRVDGDQVELTHEFLALMLDPEGTELASPEAAHKEAVSAAIELICHRLEAGWYQSGQKIFGSSIEVTDESGAPLLTFPFAEVLTRG